MKKETYRITIICRNCKYVPVIPCVNREYGDRAEFFAVPKGTTVKVFLKSKECENCGCNGFLEMK